MAYKLGDGQFYRSIRQGLVSVTDFNEFHLISDHIIVPPILFLKAQVCVRA